MSRFYNALKEASRLQGGLLGKPSADRGVPTFVSRSEAVEEAVPIGSSVVCPLPQPQPFTDSDASLDGIAGRVSNPAPASLPAVVTRRVVFDPSARLIPNAVDSVVVEHYRRLRTKLLQQHETKPFRTLLITSPGPQEGKTVTVLNLGLSFAMLAERRVLVVDGDLRKGNLGKWLGMGEQPGFSNLLDGSAHLEDVVLKCDESPLHFLVRGTSQQQSAELLHPIRLRSQFQRMEKHFDIVLIDSPPVNLVTDAQLLASGCDAVLLLARAFATNKSAIEKALQDLSSFRVLGAVLNGGTRAKRYRRYHGYY